MLVVWFGSIDGHGTIGDLLSVQSACLALEAAGFDAECWSWCPVDHVRCVPPRSTDARDYDLAVFVCGPIMAQHHGLEGLLASVDGLPLLGVGVSLFPEGHWNYLNPFDRVLAREGGQRSYGDIAIAAPREHTHMPDDDRVLRVGISLRGHQGEYTEDACRHEMVDLLVGNLLAALARERKVDVTVLEHRLADLDVSPAAVDLLYSSQHLIVTTRLHGAILAARNQVPFLAIDQIAGGAKVMRLVGEVWPFVYGVSDVTAGELEMVTRELVEGRFRNELDLLRAYWIEAAGITLVELSAQATALLSGRG